ncbi:hypothetical protein GGI25_002982 [Coemansia spiralis]|uniref:SMP-30/Gluconolactonase/LRE-like region domain-containing protein n=2 Tax=Coemansia TaxID=4863 RepID=A0A9W8KYV5_9FUNG|nr:hypothetical protein EDC05_002354 [Coemansia umbellata]KAJ2623788.1 hypothetical protein GGI26_002026 [Coemansia sp. RSA 1358]KAJ2677737.1 hypothetical protein GGI25_002982 [Coemansia spiralis]
MKTTITPAFFLFLVCGAAIDFVAASVSTDIGVPVYQAKPYLAAKDTNFGALIEGAAVDKDGNFYAVNYKGAKSAVGKAYESQSVFFQDSSNPNSWFNGIRFHVDSSGAQEAYLADVVNHRVVRVKGSGNKQSPPGAETFCQSSDILQPNDLAIAHSTGRLFLSGMKYTSDSVIGDGDLWTCDSAGTATRLGLFYRTNGIEVSPDEKVLYLSEAKNQGGSVVSNVIHAFDLDAKKGSISNGRILVDFAQLDNSAKIDIDGIRVDVLGNLYVARAGAGKVAKISPSGKLLAYIELESIVGVTSLEFAGPEGKDLFIVGACTADPTKGCVEKYSGDTKGNTFAKLNSSNV